MISCRSTPHPFRCLCPQYQPDHSKSSVGGCLNGGHRTRSMLQSFSLYYFWKERRGRRRSPDLAEFFFLLDSDKPHLRMHRKSVLRSMKDRVSKPDEELKGKTCTRDSTVSPCGGSPTRSYLVVVAPLSSPNITSSVYSTYNSASTIPLSDEGGERV